MTSCSALIFLHIFRYIRSSIVLFLNLIKQTLFPIVLHHRRPHLSWTSAQSMKLLSSSIPNLFATNFIIWSIGSAIVRANVLGNPSSMSPMLRIFLLISTESIRTNPVRHQRWLVPLVFFKWEIVSWYGKTRTHDLMLHGSSSYH